MNDYTASYQPMWDVSNTTTWVHGRHTLNFGGNYRRWWLQRDLANDFLGQFTFSGFFTGNAVADMLLGYYSGAQRVPAGRASASPADRAIRASSTSGTSLRTCRTTGR